MTSTRRTSSLGSACALLLLFAAGSCGGDGGDAGGNGVDGGSRGVVLAAFGNDIVVPAQETFATEASALASALNAAVDGTGSRDDAQAAWRDAMAAWQAIELMQFGPSAAALDAMGGQGLRARIYTWPTLNLCLVDQLTAGNDYDDPDALDAIAGTPRGLGAIEYLLFNDDPGNNCTDITGINRDGIWDALADEIPARRLAYAAALGALVNDTGAALSDAWAPAGGNFIRELVAPTRGGAVYGSAQEGLNAISNAMFYIEDIKDMKLAEPVGRTGCETSVCPGSVESRWAAASKEHLLVNLVTFQTLFLGANPGIDAPGFDDLLIEMGAPASDVASDMTAAIAEAIAATQAIPGSLVDALQNDLASVERAHDAVSAVATMLESEVTSMLDLEVPDRAAGDND